MSHLFPIHLGVANRRESMLDMQLGIEFFEYPVVKLLAIIDDDGVGEFESADN